MIRMIQRIDTEEPPWSEFVAEQTGNRADRLRAARAWGLTRLRRRAERV